MRVGPYANRNDEVLATWRSGIAAVAQCPNVYMKLGGVGMLRTGFDWHTRNKPIGSEELAASMAPLLTYCIEQFGPNRCMFESNFPVDKVSFSSRAIMAWRCSPGGPCHQCRTRHRYDRHCACQHAAKSLK